MYNILIKQVASIPLKSQSKWLSDLSSQNLGDIDWQNTHNLPFLCTCKSKLQVFQFKFLHRRIATENFLFKIGIASDNLCTFCNHCPETLLHLFWEWPYVQVFWKDISHWINNKHCFSNVVFSFSSCLGFVDNPSNLLFNLFLLICRYHIFLSNLMRCMLSQFLCIQKLMICLFRSKEVLCS